MRASSSRAGGGDDAGGGGGPSSGALFDAIARICLSSSASSFASSASMRAMSASKLAAEVRWTSATALASSPASRAAAIAAGVECEGALLSSWCAGACVCPSACVRRLAEERERSCRPILSPRAQQQHEGKTLAFAQLVSFLYVRIDSFVGSILLPVGAPICRNADGVGRSLSLSVGAPKCSLPRALPATR